jgi:phosphoenolpyruvate-protein phosphotransferase (PTS system enzyme I)
LSERVLRGRAASPGFAEGPLFHLGGHDEPPPPGAILAAVDMIPARFLAIDWSAGGGLVLSEGSSSGHVAVLARGRGVPLVVGVGGLLGVTAHAALLDGASGDLVLDPTPGTFRAFAERRTAHAALAEAAKPLLGQPAVTRDGTRILVRLNIDDPDDLRQADRSHCDGIGLVRTEFLFQGRGHLPGEEAQFGIYRTLAEWADGRPVTIRTLDAGGDKPVPGLTPGDGNDPFPGLRGIGLSLRRPDVFRVQIRALLRASAYGTVRAMLPMVARPAELAEAASLFAEERRALEEQGRKLGPLPLGIMVEVADTAIAIDRFDAAFFSIGSNDLTRSAAASARDAEGGAEPAGPAPLPPSVLRLVAGLVRHGRKTGREVCLCGDAAGDPTLLPSLLRTGLRSVSVSPAALGRTKLAIATLDLAGPDAVA